jgi:hypothetical protein
VEVGRLLAEYPWVQVQYSTISSLFTVSEYPWVQVQYC